jgi:hypothetical protein
MQQEPRPVTPLPKWKQYIVLAVVVAGAAGIFYALRPGAESCTTKSYAKQADNTTCELSGTVGQRSGKDKQLTAKRLGGSDLDQFDLTDASGTAPVWFDPSDFLAPAVGAQVKVSARVMRLEGSDIRRLVASEIETR